MADLVLGLAKSAVEGTLSVAKSAIEEEEKLKKSVQRDLMLISDEFEMMHSFLNVAKERGTDDMVRTFVRQVRNMALDMEDCIESVVLMDIKSHFWRRFLPSCMLVLAAAPDAALDDALTSIELLKSRVEAMGQRNERYRYIGSSSSKSTENAHQQAIADATAVGILTEVREAKKQGSPRDLIELINKIDHVLPLQAISLWGAVGDLGVASIIKKTCEDPEICKSFRCRAWVKVMHPFNPHEFICSLLAQFYTNYGPQHGNAVDFVKLTDLRKATEDVLMKMFMKQVSDQRYLIFLEDVSCAVDWEAIRVYLPDKKNGSCIIVYTQQLEVASLCVGQSHRVFELEQFSAEHSVCVFFNENKPSSPKGLIELINKKVDALPLQVVSVLGAIDNLGVAKIMNICEDYPGICNNFRSRAKVKLMHPFNPNEFIRSLLAQWHKNYCLQKGSAADFLRLNGMMDMESRDGGLIEFMKQVMSEQRYLIFLEDLSSTDNWEAVREYLPDEKNGSCVVVHTERLEVARKCVGESHQILELEPSSVDHSIRVFFNEERLFPTILDSSLCRTTRRHHLDAFASTIEQTHRARDEGVAMADLVLGLAKSAVEGTLSVAKSAIEEEEKLKKSVQRDLMLISDEFEMMHSFLNVAKERGTDDMVRTFVRQVRNMALDMEDCIESVVLMDIKSHFWRRFLPSCMLVLAAAPDAALDDALTSIELLKSRVEAMGQRNERYRYIGSSSSKSTENAHQQAIADATAVGILTEVREAKKQGSPRDLIELINKIDHVLPLQAISLWGAVGDLGVASIIKKTCEDPEICKSFRCRAWVKVMHPFNPHEFICSLLAQFYTNYGPQHGNAVDFVKLTDLRKATEDVLMKMFMKQVSDQRYLIFLEDVSCAVDWEAIRVYLPDKKNGSCIIVYTQQLEVASLCVGQSHRVFELEQFSAEHSVCVFFNENKPSSPKGLIELINKKVDALPLQVVSVLGAIDNLGVAKIMNICEDYPGICNNFRSRAKVKLMHPFNPNEFIRSLLAQWHKNYCLQKGSAADFLRLNGMMDMESRDGGLIEFMKQVMSEQRYLIFLEDLSSTDNWEAVREYLPDEKNGSCVVVHTERLEVARKCVGESHQILELEPSSVDHSIRVFFNENMYEDEDRAIKTKAAKEWLDKCQLVGRKADHWFLYERSPGVCPVYGIAGVGKSYIVKYVYYKQVIAQQFEKFGWVDVSHPFNVRDFSRSLLLDLHSGSLQQGSMLRIKDPIQECCHILRQHRCLIVIDGLQSTKEWDSIKAALPFENCRIIVITHEEIVANYCSKNSWSGMCTVGGLDIDHALDLLKRKASSSWPEVPSPGYIEKQKVMLHKCGGLPQVIAAVGDSMADGWTINGDENFIGILENHPSFGSLKALFDWVGSYFHSCDDRLKPCIFYLSIFPVNHKIRQRRLVRRWIAEGYSRDTKDMTAEENAEKSILDLHNLNMVQVPGSRSLTHRTRMPLCQVNGFFREYIISRSMEENLVFELAGHCSVNSQRYTGRHLTIGSTWDRDKSLYESIDFSRLRSLTVFGKWETFFISDNMSILRVLDLEDASSVTDGDLEQMLMLLPRLKFLSLRRCREITRLPDSFGGLRQLQTVDIRHTSVVKLPVCITKIKKLQHIRAGTTVQLDAATSSVDSLTPSPEAGSATATHPSMRRPPPAATPVSRFWFPESWTRRRQLLPGSQNGGVEVPRGIGKMMMVHNISVIDVGGASGPAIMEELKNLTQLRKLGVSGVKSDNCKELCSAISGYAHLESLSLWLEKNQDGCLDSISQPPEKLRSLKLYGHVDKLPAWIKQLSNLTKLKLRLTKITQHEVDLLRDLPSLNTLCLCFEDFEYGELRFTGWRCSRRLWVLEIVCNSRLQSVTFADNAIPHLEVLKIGCCNVQSSLKFYGLEKLQDLREILLSGSYDDKVKQHLQDELKNHSREMKPVLKEDAGSSRWALIS